VKKITTVASREPGITRDYKRLLEIMTWMWDSVYNILGTIVLHLYYWYVLIGILTTRWS